MEQSFDLLLKIRQLMLKIVSSYNAEQLNIIPEGFNNNMIWNLGHVLVTQQLLCYGLSGLKMDLDEDFIAKYRKGSFPNSIVDQGEIDFIKSNLIVKIEEIKSDYSQKKFLNYSSYMTSLSYELNNIEQAIEFNNFHEGIHLGTLLALRKVIKKYDK